MSSHEQDHDPSDQDRAHQAEEESDDGGAVSEVSMMAGAEPDPIQPDQAVAGSPNDEQGAVDEGAQGPNANPNAGASGT